MFQFACKSDLCVLPRLSLWSIVIFDRELKSCIALRTIYYIRYPEVGYTLLQRLRKGFVLITKMNPPVFSVLKILDCVLFVP